MTPDDPRHGTYTGYRRGGCRCFPCRLADHHYRTEFRADQSAGVKRIVDAQPARDHFDAWKAATGRGIRVFARVSGIPARTVTSIVSGGAPRCRLATVEAFLAVPVVTADICDVDQVSSIGTVRRVRALGRIGWTRAQISEAAGMPDHWVGNLLCHKFIDRTSADRVASVYEELSMILGTSNRARNHAERNSWAPPLAWDDIDDPSERPKVGNGGVSKHDVDPQKVERVINGDRLPLTTAERRVIVNRMRAAGWSLVRIERHTGITKADRYVERREGAA